MTEKLVGLARDIVEAWLRHPPPRSHKRYPLDSLLTCRAVGDWRLNQVGQRLTAEAPTPREPTVSPS
jgi:hypothetical protein